VLHKVVYDALTDHLTRDVSDVVSADTVDNVFEPLYQALVTVCLPHAARAACSLSLSGHLAKRAPSVATRLPFWNVILFTDGAIGRC
jgi:hypothetical protein